MTQPNPAPGSPDPESSHAGDSQPGDAPTGDSAAAEAGGDVGPAVSGAAEAEEAPHLVLTMGWGLGTHTGVARHARELARYLARAGARVTLVCVQTAGYSRFPRPELELHMRGMAEENDLRRDGVRIVRVDPHPLHWIWDGKPVAAAVEGILAKEKVDLVLGFYNEVAYLPRLLQKRGIPFGFIATWLSYAMALDPARLGRGPRRYLKKHSNKNFVLGPYRRADILFANSEFTRGELIDVVGVDPEKIRVTYLGVEESFTKIPRRRPEKISRLLFFGRAVREKGIADAIEALAKVAKRGNRDWTLRIVGSGHHDHVRRIADGLGIGTNVVLSGHVGDEELRRELAEAHLAVLPSHSESFGLSIAEAQAAGLAVVAYAAGSVPEVVEKGRTAWLSPLGNIEDLSRCLEEALAYPHTTHERGLRGRERVKELFRWENTAERVLAGWREIASR